jgi:hypothetical protein
LVAPKVLKSIRLAIAAFIGIVAVGVLLVLLPTEDPPAALPPIAPSPDAPAAPAEPPVSIPSGLLPIEARASQPPPDPEAHWESSDMPNLPPLASPCGGYLPSDADRVAARQVALVHPNLWKLVRLVVYRDAAAAERAMSERRDALVRCARHEEDDGAVTAWTSEPLAIGDEAMFVGSQRYRGDEPTHGHGRGVLMRQGRTLVTWMDFGQLDSPPLPAEVVQYQDEARILAEKLASASFNSP